MLEDFPVGFLWSHLPWSGKWPLLEHFRSPGLLFSAVPIAASCRNPLPILANCFFWAASLSYFIWIQANIPTTNSYSFSKTDTALIYNQRRLQFIPQMPCPLLLPQTTLQHLGTELLGFLTCRGPTNAGKLSDDPLKIPERRLGQEVAHIPITQKSFQKSHRLHLFHPAFVWGTFR